MAGQHVQVGDLSTRGQRVLIDTKAVRVGEVVAQMAHHLENVLIFDIAGNGDLCLQGLHRNERLGLLYKGRRVDLRQERCLASCSWSC